MEFNMIFAICPADKVDEIINSAKRAGATGATIINARGTGHKEVITFFGLTLDMPQNALALLVERSISNNIMRAVYSAGNMEEAGNGICFSLNVDSVLGLESQLSVNKK
ncbi:MAG TPA: P-II family nitrogen regulator [Nitrospinota bacterium]|nr:P-II family nitrogen regulator [Nitrospinota bacterium]|tara:strand:- start:82183 stop:82509 length:327 start_codon:yes stop_codon:yes gene_type:complete